MKFSERMGIVPVKQKIQIDSMDTNLRNGLWNAFNLNFLEWLSGQPYNGYIKSSPGYFLLFNIWANFYKEPADEIPDQIWQAIKYIKEKYYTYKWNEVYDFIEFLPSHKMLIVNKENQNGLMTFFKNIEKFIVSCNEILIKEVAGYRFLSNKIVPISNNTELQSIDTALENTNEAPKLLGAHTHLKTALDLLSDRQNPDYRNSMKESISAIESICKVIANNEKATLGIALESIFKNISLHPALKDGFKKLYGYTSDSSGIRHALHEEPTLDFEDAKYMLVSCSAFLNYLISKASKAGIDITS